MQVNRRDYWVGVIAEQEAGGQTVKALCEQRRLSIYNFYTWRRRLRPKEPAPRFALVRSKPAPATLRAPEPALELILATGERLRIHNGTDAATLRLALDAIRA